MYIGVSRYLTCKEMSYKIWIKKTSSGIERTSIRYAVIDILQKNGGLSQAKIQKILKSDEYKIIENKTNKDSTISRMGLWEILEKLEKEGEIEKVVFDGVFGFAVTNKSKILAEVQGNFFRAHFKNNMIQNNVDLLQEFKKETSTVDPLLKFLGFYVLGSLITSDLLETKHITNKKLTKKQQEELRQIWLNSVLNLQKGLPISDFYDNFFNHSEKNKLTIVKQLAKSYKENMNLFGDVMKHIEDNYPKIKTLSDKTFDKSVLEALKDKKD
jgi:hypothetical protein